MDKKKILLVEDDLFLRELYADFFEKSGYSIIPAEDGNQALRLIKQKPDLVLLDIMLPKMNGIDVLRKFKADTDTKNIPVIILSNLGQDDIFSEAQKIGIQDYIIKMRYTPRQIVDRINHFFAQKNNNHG